jgi:hypothetical protein
MAADTLLMALVPSLPAVGDEAMHLIGVERKPACSGFLRGEIEQPCSALGTGRRLLPAPGIFSIQAAEHL